MRVILISNTPNPEKTVACAAKLCYANSNIDDLYNGLTDKKAEDFIEILSSYGHESPIEHVSFTFGIEGISRACSHQLVRHRLASYSQQSQRYVDMDDFQYVVPPEVESDAVCKQIFTDAMEAAQQSYQALADKLTQKYLSQQNISADNPDYKSLLQTVSKKAFEDARFILPNACETKIIMTMNARSLMNFFRARCCNRAQWEIKAVADEMLKLVCNIAPNLFSGAGPACYKNACNEGKMSCKQSSEVRAFYKGIHKL